MKELDKYQILQSLGKGGMGEVFLAYDPLCKRQVALKMIRHDLLRFSSMQERFLREAEIAAQLTHPSIVPIYSISKEPENIYYTMPYIEGETLKTILRISREQEKQEKTTHPIGSSIPTLARIFLSICQAIAYTHSKGILHRDIKPENIIIGKYGEVMLLDWGLADFLDNPLPDSSETLPPTKPHLTDPGKIVGTITFLAPERALGERASILTDIYALGALLYQILTLHLPFKRTDLASYKKIMHREELIDPQEIAPYRDIPEQLAQIAKKCLSFDKTKRYQTVQELTADLENYIEGKPEWLLAAELDSNNKNHWEFQENILLAKHIAITRETDIMEWVSLMVSKESFSGNSALETYLSLNEESEGVGFLMSIPETKERKGLEEGYCLWIGSKSAPGCKLVRSQVEVMSLPDLFLTEGEIRIEKTDHNVRVYLDGLLKMDYFSNIPSTGSHVGLLYRDDLFSLSQLKIFLRAQNVMVNCLAVPDALLANKHFSKALDEYRRIGHCFHGRTEGWEALFRAGITLIQEGSFALALEEFTKLHHTAGAPLEYLGKSLVYKAEKDVEEEIKCLELALRKFSKHPLLPLLIEHVMFRLHEASYKERLAAYHFALLTKRLLPTLFFNPDHKKLIESLEKHSEPLLFLEKSSDTLLISLSFWLAKPLLLAEMIEHRKNDPLFIANALFALLKLEEIESVNKYLPFLEEDPERKKFLIYALMPVEEGFKAFFSHFYSSFSLFAFRTLIYLFEKAIDEKKPALALLYFEPIDSIELTEQQRLELDIQQIWALLQIHDYDMANKILKRYPLELLTDEWNPLFFLFGIALWVTEGEEIAKAHFLGATEMAYPPIPSLLGHFLSNKLTHWNAFLHEQKELDRQRALFSQATLLPLPHRQIKIVE